MGVWTLEGKFPVEHIRASHYNQKKLIIIKTYLKVSVVTD